MKENWLYLFIISFYTGGLSLGVTINSYYLPPVIMCLVLVIVLNLNFGKRIKRQVFALFFMCSLFLSILFEVGPGQYPYMTSIRYVDAIKLLQGTLQKLEERNDFESADIWSEWPISVYLRFPYLGYVKKENSRFGSRFMFDHFWFSPNDVYSLLENTKNKGADYVVISDLMSPSHKKIMQTFVDSNRYEEILSSSNVVGSISVYKKAFRK